MRKWVKALQEEMMRIARRECRDQLERHAEENRRSKARLAAVEKELRTVRRELKIVKAATKMRREKASPDPDNVRMSATQIKALRKRLGLTQAEFAVLAGCSSATVSFWESGETRPRPEAKLRLHEMRQLGKTEARALLEKNSKKTKKRKVR